DLHKKVFLKLCETLNFSRTAETLGVSRQAVSKAMNRLESSLGCRLIEKQGRGSRLTECGELLMRYLLEEESRFEELRQLLYFAQNRQGSQLVIGMQTQYRFKEETMLVMEFSVEYEGKAQIQLLHDAPGRLQECLSNGSVDLVIACKNFLELSPDFAWEDLRTTPAVLLVSCLHPDATEDADVERFKDAPLVVSCFENEPTERYRRRADRLIRRYGLRSASIIEAANADSAHVAVIMNRGVMVATRESNYAPPSIVRSYSLGAAETICCLWRKNDENPLLKTFIRRLKEVAEGVDYVE
ncbi:MAG: LysR family transcriptional regulator, partial [Lachnospiraceae bacterium]|nr:LysR family transcriptional regulator [Lachnospiraceae bacterium]